MNCSYCGAEFEPNRPNQKYCSDACREMANGTKPKTKICKNCGKPFTTCNRRKVYCSDACMGQAYRSPKGDKNREFTPLTPYLCQKWRKEGMSVKEIALILHRTPENVRKALRVKLSPGQYAAMEVYKR